jgi:hypothetical protein
MFWAISTPCTNNSASPEKGGAVPEREPLSLKCGAANAAILHANTLPYIYELL